MFFALSKQIFKNVATYYLLLVSSFVTAVPPLALHQLVEVDPGGEVVLMLHGHDLDGDETIATITSLPESGVLYQLSYVYDTHGYDPKIGTKITSVPSNITGKKNRIVYKRPASDSGLQHGEWGRFTYNVKDKEGQSLDGTVVLVQSSGQVVASNFRMSSEGWSTIGNRKDGVTHEESSRGIMNYYIYAADNSINTNEIGNDIDVWYFLLPKKFHGWQGIIYRGTFEFSLSSFGGDFGEGKQNFLGELNIVEISCETCNLFKGATIGFPLKATGVFDGSTKRFSLPMTESSGWVKDPKNVNHKWTVPSKCDFIQIISGITSIKILGDFTTWYESVSIDDVEMVAPKSRGRYLIPTCAQVTPDARKCDCDDIS